MSWGIESSRGRARVRLLFVGVLATALSVATPGSGGAQQAAATELFAPDVALYPAQLERGADTPLLHIEEEVIVDGDLRVPVRGPAHVWLMGSIGRDYLVTTAGPNFRRYTVQLVRRDGDRRVLQRFGDRTMATMSADGRRLALTRPARPGTEIRIVRTRSGELVRARTFRSSGVEVSDYGRQRLVITGLRGGTHWWNPVRNRLRLIVPRPGKADISVDRLVFLVPHPDRPYRDCQKTVRLSRPTEVLWRSCRNIPLNFSPDARRMLTVDIQADGIGPRTVQVRRARGRLVQTYRAPMWFGFTEWESATDLLLQPVGRKYLAAVRCSLGDGCERASRLYRSPGTYDPPESMRWSFPQ
jgi:hypothetical protein